MLLEVEPTTGDSLTMLFEFDGGDSTVGVNLEKSPKLFTSVSGSVLLIGGIGGRAAIVEVAVVVNG